MRSLQINDDFLIYDEERNRFYMATDSCGANAIACAAFPPVSDPVNQEVTSLAFIYNVLATVLHTNTVEAVYTNAAEINKFVSDIVGTECDVRQLTMYAVQTRPFVDPQLSVTLYDGTGDFVITEVRKVAHSIAITSIVTNGDYYQIARCTVPEITDMVTRTRLVQTAAEATLLALGVIAYYDIIHQSATSVTSCWGARYQAISLEQFMALVGNSCD